ncbi:hypothetical protein N9O19_01610, partial [Euryarchaeota archaeon]|nr:hypothetical protein [Euryarchaeota archaeon]
TVEPTAQCAYTNYFTTAIVGTDLVFTLIPDATTNGYDWEVDYMNDNGIHQLRPGGQTWFSRILLPHHHTRLTTIRLCSTQHSLNNWHRTLKDKTML